MSAAPTPTWSRNGANRGNLFLDGDPEAVAEHQRSVRSAEPRQPPPARRGRGLIVPVGKSPSGSATTAAAHRPDAAAFTRSTTGLAGLQPRARKYARRADANARRLAAELVSRRHAALLALAAVGALLLAASWLGLALRDATAARRSADRRLAAATAAAKREQALVAAASKQDQARIATLAAQLEQARVAARQRPATTGSPSPAKRRGAPAHRQARKH